MQQIINSDEDMKYFGKRLARLLKGGDVIELVGDVGAGKTVLTKGIAQGLGITETVQSPTFTISRVYDNGTLRLAHYDFYRLTDAGIMANELQEVVDDDEVVVVVEWGDIVSGVIPDERLRIAIQAIDETTREVTVQGFGARSKQLVEDLK